MTRLAVILLSLTRLSLPTCILLLAVSTTQAQILTLGDDTSTPVEGAGHDYIKTLSETVSPNNGSVSIRIGTFTPRGRGLALPFSFSYDSNGVQHAQPGGSSFISNQTFLSSGGWGYSLPMTSIYSWSITTQAAQGLYSTCNYASDYVFQDPSGGRHNLGVGVASYSQGTEGHYLCAGPVTAGGDPQYSAALNMNVNGPGYVYPPFTISDADGTVYSSANSPGFGKGVGFAALPGSIEDRNGNRVTITQSQSGSFTVTDPAGRNAIVSNGFGPSGTTNTLTIAGKTYQVTWKVTHPNYSVSALSTKSPASGYCPSFASINSAETVVSAITLPNGQQYKFYYGDDNPNGYSNPYGLLSEIDYPSGAWVRFTWKLSDTYSEALTYDSVDTGSGSTPYGCQFEYKTPVVATRQLGFGGSSTPQLTQTFAYNTTWATGPYPTGPYWNSKTTKVTTTDALRNQSFLTTYNYGPLLVTSNNAFDAIAGAHASVAAQVPVEVQIQYYDWGNTTTPLRTVTKNWFTEYTLACEFQTLDNGLVSGAYYSYGPGAQVTDKKEYDYGQVSSAGTCQGSTTAPASPTPARETTISYQTFTTPLGGTIYDKPSVSITYGAGARVAETDYAYDETAVGSASAVQHDDAYYPAGSGVPRGNLTTKTQKCFVGAANCVNAVTKYGYDQTGQVTSVVDPCGNASCSDMVGTNHTTTYAYTDSYTSGGTPPGNTSAYLTRITDPLGHIANFSYDYASGELTVSQDANGQSTTYQYNDLFFRPTQVSLPDGGLTTISYNDSPYNSSNNTPSVTSTKKITSGLNVVSTVAFDGIGHEVKTILSSDPDGSTYTTTSYDGQGNKYQVSNPYRSTSDSSYGVTTYVYDALSRPKTATEPGGTIQTAYCGNATLVTDEAGHWRRSTSDALGRLTKVEEPNSRAASVAACPQSGDPTLVTAYTYDALNDLTGVTQAGSRSRTFAYNSLGRLISSTNPESNTAPSNGSIVSSTYLYDAEGNLVSKTVPAQNQQSTATVTLSYCYDPLSRMTSKAYTAQSCPMPAPVATFSYDQSGCLGQPSCYNVGRRTGMTDAAGSESWSYDTMGRVLTDQRTTNGLTKSTIYTYQPYVDGSLYNLQYPSGRVLTFQVGAGERPVSAVDTSNSVYYATGAHYAPQGALAAVTYNDNVFETNIYNSSLRPCWIYTTTSTALPWNGSVCSGSATVGSLLDLKYNFNPGADNGSVVGITNDRDTTRSQSFTYDQVNRIVSGQTGSTGSTSPAHCWGQAFAYDNWGNLLSVSAVSSAYNNCTQGSLSVSVNPQNRIIGDTYDTAGNLYNVPGTGGASYTYNADNQLTATSGAAFTYIYDGDGQRREKSGSKLYWYGPGGEVLEETDATGSTSNGNFNEYIYFGDRRIARRDGAGNVFYYFTDLVGSSRAIAKVAFGQSTATLCYDADFLPFGEEHAPVVNTCAQNYKFTGKERDSESGLDNFGARYMASTMGRFMSADPFTVTPGRVIDPQQLNLYAYVRNNPLKHIDPTGMIIDDAACKQDMKHCGKDWQKVQDIANQQDKNGNYLHPELHNELTTLQNDSRTFTIENSSLGAGTAGQFTITNFTADGKDFTRATLQLDFKQIKGISGVTGADLVPGFNKYQGLLDSPMYRLAETFGHEAGHGLFSIQNPAQAVGIQQLLNQRDAAMQGQHYPYPPDVMQKMQQADQALIPTERFAQQVEKIVNGELSADKKKQ